MSSYVRPSIDASAFRAADALIGHLSDTYDVNVDEGAEATAALLRPAYHDVVRAVRITAQ